MSIEITLDGRPVSAQDGQLLVDVAAENGIYIPTLCHVKNQPALGTCRVCSIRVNGAVVPACAIVARDGIVVEMDTPEMRDMRKALVESLFVEGNHNCPSCEKSGRCQLQAVGYEVDMMVARFPYRYPVREADHEPDRIWLERDRCIFCQRCVELVKDEATGARIFTIHGRGPSARIDVDAELVAAMTPRQVKQAVALCPVGAILEKGVGFDEPIGHRKFEIRTARARALGKAAE